MAKHRLVPWTVLVLLVLVVWFFFVHGLAKSPASQEEQESVPTSPMPFRRVPHELATEKNEVPTPASPVEAMSPQVADFQKKIHDCFPDLNVEGITNSEQLLRQEVTDNPVQKTQFEMENTHIELPDGSLRRIHLIPSEKANSANILELRYFKLDAEGLPERIPLSDKETYNPSKEFIDSLKSQGRVVFHQTKEHRWLKDGTQIEINRVDHQIFELQISQPDKTLSCRALRCLCH